MCPSVQHTTGLEIMNQKLKHLLNILTESTHKCFVQVDLTDYASRSFPDNIQNSNHLKEEIIGGFKDIFTIINASRSSTAVTMNEKLKLPIVFPLFRMFFPSWVIIFKSSLDNEE